MKVLVKAVAMATENSNRAAPARMATGMATGMATAQNAAPANARHITSATRPRAQNAPVQSVRAQTVRATTVPAATSGAAMTISARSRHAQKVPIQAPMQAPMQAPARKARAQKAPVKKASVSSARSVPLTLALLQARVTPSTAIRTDRVPSVRTPNAQIAANLTPPIVPITPVSRQVIEAATGAANAKAAASKTGTASARPSF